MSTQSLSPSPPKRALGIDVSHWHPVTVATMPSVLNAGVSFMGVKATDGLSAIDDSFALHRKLCRQNSAQLALTVYYHFARAGSALAQAEHFLKATSALQPTERVCLDLEGQLLPEAPQKMLTWIETFFDRISREHPDRKPLVYTSVPFWSLFGNPAWGSAAQIALWAPRYNLRMAEPVVPRPWLGTGWHFWQWTDGSMPPFSIPTAGSFDASFFRSDEAALRAWVAATGPANLPGGIVTAPFVS